MRLLRPILLFAALCAISACSSLPGERDDSFAAAPIVAPPPPEENGAIFQSYAARAAYTPLFEDQRPRQVGDILTVVLNEEVSASKNSSSSASRNGSTSFTPEILPKGLEDVADYGFDLSGGSDFSGNGAAQANNRLTGTITVTVADVLPNGNLAVVGEKQIAINQGTEFIRFSGIVDPRNVNDSNSVSSTQVAAARIEYVGEGYLNEAQRMGWMQRILLNVSPF